MVFGVIQRTWGLLYGVVSYIAVGRNNLLDDIQRRLDLAEQETQVTKNAVGTLSSQQEDTRNQLTQLKVDVDNSFIPTRDQFYKTLRKLQYRDGTFHFAVAGIAGTGKSTFINSIRGLRSKDTGAAAVTSVETTLQITRYQDPDPKKPIAWYDVPGAGTLQIPGSEYFKEQGMYAFDAIIVILGDRFTETDVAILKNCARLNIPTYIVRSKAMRSIKDKVDQNGDESDDPDAFRRARVQFIAEVQRNVAQNLKKAQLPDKRVYIIDAMKCLVELVRKQQVDSGDTHGLGAEGQFTARNVEKFVIDEKDLLFDILNDAFSRRGKFDFLNVQMQVPNLFSRKGKEQDSHYGEGSGSEGPQINRDEESDAASSATDTTAYDMGSVKGSAQSQNIPGFFGSRHARRGF